MKRRNFLATTAAAGAASVGTTLVQACSTPVEKKHRDRMNPLRMNLN